MQERSVKGTGPPGPAGRRPPVGGGAGHPKGAKVSRAPSRLGVKRRAFLALGSNLGDRWGYLRQAALELPDVECASGVYESDPVGGPPGQGAYLNAVLELHTSLSARELLLAAQAAEDRAGRVRAEKWGPRTLDVDLLLVGDETYDEADLVVPHPRMWERGFVVVPLADLAPELVVGRLEGLTTRGVRLVGRLFD